MSNYFNNWNLNNAPGIYFINGFELSQSYLKTKVRQNSGINILALIFTMFIYIGLPAFSQSPEIIIDGSTFIGPNSSCSASLDLLSEEKGLLINRVHLTSTMDKSTVPLLCHTMLVYNLNTQSDITPGFYWWDALAAIPHWVPLSSGSGAGPEPWLLTGNSNTFTDYTNNLLGTLTGTNMPLNFIVNGQRAGRIELNPNTANTFFGYKSGNVNTGTNNTATGYLALTTNSNGNFNTAIGNSALQSNVSGSWNTAVGNIALQMNRTGHDNTALGDETLSNNTTGSNNTATGGGSLLANTVGNDNTATGLNSLRSNLSGNDNTALGYYALFSNTEGSQNTATGTNTLNSNTSGGNNTATGINAMKGNLTGSQNTATGEGALLVSNASYNTATGVHSLYSTTSGTGNTADGVDALRNNIIGKNNSALGRNALNNSNGDNNIGIGYQSGLNVSTGNNIITIGSGLPGVNTSNTTYMANIWGTSVAAGINGGGPEVLQVIVNSDGQLGTVPVSNNGSDIDDWKLLGNANTTEGTNFLGTTNQKYLDFRVNNLRSGHIDWDNTKANTFFGYSAGIVTTGTNNTATGYLALTTNNNGNFNTAIGNSALQLNTTGSWNTAVGNIALQKNTTGNDNTALGDETLSNNTTGSNNTAIGGGALLANTVGNNNIATGNNSLRFNTTGNNNVASGYKALYENTTGGSNTAYGNFALMSNLGSQNTATGTNALNSNTSGGNNTATGINAMKGNLTGSQNTATGEGALLANNANYNTATGVHSLYENTSGNNNTADGVASLQNNITGSRNSAVGSFALFNNKGNDNIGIGYQSGMNVSTGSNIITIGSGLPGLNTPDNRTYVANIYPTTVTGKVVYVDANGMLGTNNASSSDPSDNWLLVGNNPGNSNINVNSFLGTTAGVNFPLTFKVNDVRSGLIDFAPTLANTFFGYSAGIATTGAYNTATGYLALTANSTGYNNTAIGYLALTTNSTGYNNTAIGNSVLQSNITGYNNTATGYLALNKNTTGGWNTANGNLALNKNTTGSNNTATGVHSMRSTTSGTNNTSYGVKSLEFNITGNNNSAVGLNSLINSKGDNNIGIGSNSGAAVTSSNNVITIGTNLPGVNASNTTYMANIWGTSIAAGINGGGAAVLQVVVNSDGQLGTISASGGSNDDWKLLGNANTVEGQDFLGTTDSKYLDFRVNNIRSGHIDWDGNKANTFFGFSAGFVTTGRFNTATGYLALTANSTGSWNTAVGNSALQINTTGGANTALGTGTLASNTSGTNNTATGSNALVTNTTGGNNTATGLQALYSNIEGDGNIATGGAALYNNTVGDGNTALGLFSLYNNTTGNKNIGIGRSSGTLVTTADNMICIGDNIAGDNVGNHTYIANIHNTTVTGTLVAPVLSVVVNSDGLLGTIQTPGTGTDANWKLLGNANTVEGTHFLGTTDAKYLDFRVNDLRSGHIDWDNTKANTFFGFSAGIANTGANNTATGYLALTTNTTGYYNTANGVQSLVSNTTGNNNTANGALSLYSNTNGSYNTANGMNSLSSNTTGSKNTANGVQSLVNNTTGNDNTANGAVSLLYNTTGNNNTATGALSLYYNTTGYNNTATGYLALTSNSTGNYNTADGAFSLNSNTTGAYNTAVGINSLTNSNGDNNIGIGYQSGTAVTTADNMICIGSNIAGDNVGNHTYIANIHGTTVAGTTAGGPALSVVVNSDGLLGTKTTPFTFTHYIGEEFECGVIFYLFRDASGTEHGLIVSPTDVSTSSVWSDPVNTTGATSPWDGSGTNPGNSYKIQQNTTSSAAEECMGYSTGSCSSDWYLPSMDELSLLFDASYIVNRTLGSSGQLANAYYWSSTEKSSTDAIVRGFGTMGGIPGSEKKDFTHYVRAIRAF